MTQRTPSAIHIQHDIKYCLSQPAKIRSSGVFEYEICKQYIFYVFGNNTLYGGCGGGCLSYLKVSLSFVINRACTVIKMEPRATGGIRK
jgi:hypothetical protein